MFDSHISGQDWCQGRGRRLGLRSSVEVGFCFNYWILSRILGLRVGVWSRVRSSLGLGSGIGLNVEIFFEFKFWVSSRVRSRIRSSDCVLIQVMVRVGFQFKCRVSCRE